MSDTTDQVLTAEQLAARPDDGNRYELVDGVLLLLSPAVEQRSLGETYAAETGFLIQRSPDTVRATDVAFVASGRLEEYADHVGYLPLAPDLVAEVVSPGDSSSEVEAKVEAWLDAGVQIVLAVDPQTSTVRVHRSKSQFQDDLRGCASLDKVLSGFQLDVAELFA